MWCCASTARKKSRNGMRRTTRAKAASLPDRRVTYQCKDGEPFDVYFPPGGAGAVLSIGGDDFALREVSSEAGRRYGDDHYDLYFKDDGTAYLMLEDKRIRDRCKRD